MKKGSDPTEVPNVARVLTDVDQLTFDYVEPYKYDITLVGSTPHGYGLYRMPNEVGSHTYYTDQYGLGYMVYDPLTDLVSTFAAMVHEDAAAAKDLWVYLGVTFEFSK